ncbi:SigB/SigF/SigG family RNA polymerase sigma factor [Nocardia jiangsuensis]|uniref:SigB/SigF/SigG family RNA polymerase sigma factor n=1 Tax=Nocardia jiangsuensis TaxID=1691563 RepID=A0ABV8DZX9_9NOCA
MRPTTSAVRAKRGPDSYDDLEPRLTELAALDEADPARARLRAEIITAALPLAEHIAARYGGRGEALEDLTQVATVGLVQAVDRFDPGLGSPFLAFAVPTVMGEVRRHFRDRAWGVRVPRPVKELQQRLGGTIELLSQRLQRMPTAREIAAELDVDVVEVTQALLARNGYRSESLEAMSAGSDEPGSVPAGIEQRNGAVDPSYRLLEDAMTVGPLLRELPERERQILVWRFFDNLTQSQIAARLGISQMQISRILSRTLERLREQALAEPAA